LKKAALWAVSLVGILMIISTVDFPSWGDFTSPASTSMGQRFIEKSYEETHTPNIVTAVLADYRGFDTMFETVVVFIAGLACFFIVRIRKDECIPDTYYYRHKTTGIVVHKKQLCALPLRGSAFEQVDADWAPQDVVITTICRLLIPFIQIFGLYVLAHGHYSPGGGFQAGVLIAATFILLAISHDLRTLVTRLKESTTHLISVTGVLLYFGIGVSMLLTGHHFLDYNGLAGLLGMSLSSGHSLGILLVEVGVALTVAASLITIFKLLSSKGTVTEGL
jgi:multicomponent Na+:H+ antiporter subunit B